MDQVLGGRRLFGPSLLLALVLAGASLLIASRGARWHEFEVAIAHGHPAYLPLCALVFSVSLVLRSLRWRVLLSAPQPIARTTVFWATALGYLGNDFLPARAGEVIRTLVIARRAALSVPFVLATAVAERVMDAVALALAGSAVALALPGLPLWLPHALQVLVAVSAAALPALWLLPRSELPLLRLLERLPLRQSAQRIVAGALRRFLLGMGALQQPGRAVRFCGLTALIWMVDTGAALAVASMLQLALTPAQALLLLVGLGLSSAAPSTPGYVGIYQFVAVTVLIPFGMTRSQALAYIVTFQATSYATVLAWGLPAIWQVRGVRRAGTPAAV